jgi:hypothetical protein
MKVHAGLGVEVIVSLAVVGFLALVMAGLAQLGGLVEKRVGPGRPLTMPKRPTPAFFMFQWWHLQLNRPGGRARVRNVCFVFGALAIAPYVALLIYNRA